MFRLDCVYHLGETRGGKRHDKNLAKINTPMKLSALANRTLVIKLIAAITTYGFTILLARTMAPQEFGKVALFLNLSLIMSVIGARGQQLSALRFAPPLTEKNDVSGRAVFFGMAARKAATGTIIAFSICLCAAFLTQAFGGFALYSVAQIWLGLALIPLVGWVDLQSHMARGCGLLRLSLIPKEIAWRAGAGVVVLGLFLIQKQTLNTTDVLLSLALCLLLIATLQARHLVQEIGLPNFRNLTTDDHKKDWNGTTNPFWITSVSNIFLTNADVILLGLFAGPRVAGAYFAANRLAMLLSFFQTSYNVVLAPALANAWQSDKPHETSDIIHRATFKMSLPTLLFGTFLFLLAPQFLGLFGPGFGAAVTPLRILILAALVNTLTGPADIALNMGGFHRPAMGASALSLAVSTLLLAVGAVWGGATGIAIAVLFSTAFRKLIFWWLAMRHMSVRTDILAALWPTSARAYGLNQ